jgi:pyruvate formate lyase activating enzyme
MGMETEMATVKNKSVEPASVPADDGLVSNRIAPALPPLRFVPTPVRDPRFQISGINGFLDTSFIDWDGMVAAVLFMGSCNMACPFCHDHGLFEPDVDSLPFSSIRYSLLKHHEWLDGVVISGGEPTFHSCLGSMLAEFKTMGFKTKLDTNGTRPDILKGLVQDGLVDYVAMDIKASLSPKPIDDRGTTHYDRAAGIKIQLDDIRESMDFLLADHVPYEFRTTVVPTIVGRTDLEDIASNIAGAHAYFLQPFEPRNARDSALRNVRPYSEQELALLLDLVRKYVPPATLRGTMR